MLFLIVKKRHVFLAFACVALLVTAIVISAFSGNKVIAVSSKNTNWGLSFQEKGKSPKGNQSAEFLKKYNSYYVGKPDKKVIYLTFDAGYENGYTPQILAAMKKHNVKATFFVVGNYIKTSPDLVKQMVAEGHIVGNHTYNHPDMSKISDKDSFKKEIESLESLYKETTGKDMKKYYRPPQGKFSENNLTLANELGYKTIFWSLAYVDWYVDKQPTREHALEKLTSRIHPGAIVLLHSTSKTNAEVLDELLTKWESEGYTFGTLDELCK